MKKSLLLIMAVALFNGGMGLFASPLRGYVAPQTDDVLSDTSQAFIDSAYADAKVVYVETAGTLKDLISEQERENISSLVVGGTLNQEDLNFLRYMAGSDQSGNVTGGCLQKLYMANAEIGDLTLDFSNCNVLREIVPPADTKQVYFSGCKNLVKVGNLNKVRELRSNAFRECTSLISVGDLSSCETIKSSAFLYCHALKYIGDLSNCETIEYNAFNDCNSLSSIDISNCTTIASYAFAGCSSLKSVGNLSKCVGISSYAFQGCSALQSVGELSSCTSIENNAFWGCSSLDNISFGTEGKLVTINESAFQRCANIKAIDLPSTVVTIGSNAFSCCSSLTEFNIPADSKLNNIGSNAFGRYDNYVAPRLRSFYIPKNLTSIEGIGLQTSSLEEITVNENNSIYRAVDGVLYNKATGALVMFPQAKSGKWATPSFLTTLPDNALKGCNKLTSITFSAQIDSIGAGAFSGCGGLKSLLMQKAEVPSTAADAFSGVSKSGTLVFVPKEAVEAYKNDPAWGAFKMLQAYPTTAYIYLSDSTLTLYDTQSPEPRQKDITAIVVTPQGASDAAVALTVSNDTVATVKDGHVVLLTPGTATITASAQLGDSTICATCALHGVGFEAGLSVYYIGTAGTLATVIPAAARDTITRLKLFGEINGADISIIREMAGGKYDYDNRNNNAALKFLDLGDVNVRGNSNDRYLQHWSGSYDFTSVEHYSGNNSVDGGMLFNCWRLEEVIMPSSLTSIGNATFAKCDNLRSVTMPNNTMFIPAYTFYSCPNLTEIKNVEWAELDSINNFAFYGCSSLVSIGDLRNCQTIGGEAFCDCSSLVSVGNLSNCQTIESNAFYGCSSLASVGDLRNCQTIGGQAFWGCSSLASVGDLRNCQTIESRAFNGCDSLKSITLPAIARIYDQAFVGSGIEKMNITGMTPATLGGTDIINTSKCVVIVPAAALETYRTAEKWSSFYQNIVPDDAQLEITATVKAEDGGSGILTAVGDKALSYATHLTLKGSINSYDFMLFRNKMPNLHYLDLTETTIEANPYEFVTGCYTEVHRLPEQAFKDFSKLLEIKLPNSITYIGTSAFENCANLRAVKTYPGIVTVGYGAFEACSSLERIAFEKGLSGINEGAFYACISLKHISLPEGLLSIKSGDVWINNNYYSQTFGSCAFDSIVIPSTVTDIGECTFYNCKKLKYVRLPKNLTKISSKTFLNCYALESVILPSRITSIENAAFYRCSNLKELRIPPMVETIGGEAFSGCPIKDVYVYVANSKDVAIDQNTFSCWTTATLHVPDFATASYYWNTQWSQFVNITEFSDTYDAFYTKNDLTLNSETGIIQGEPDATLHEKGALIVDDDEKQELGDIELIHDGENGASVIPEKEGNITARKARITIKVAANRWHFFCFPFDIDLDSIEYDGQYVWRQYDGLRRSRREGGWQDLPEGTTTLQHGRGYIFQGTVSGNLVLKIIKPHFSAQDILAKLDVFSSDNAVDASWNFVGNPYVSYYSIDKTTYDAPITVWTGNGYEAYRPGDDDYEFSPYEAFFVQRPEDNDAVGFKADERESCQQAQESLAKAKAFRSTQYVKPNRLLFNLTLTAQGDTTYTDRTRVVFNDRKSLAYEVGCDAAKFFSGERKAELYSTDATGTQYAINERPVGEGRVDLSLEVNKEGTYSIGGERMDAPALLIDNKTGVSHDLTLGAYEFAASKGTQKNRFTLVLRDDVTGIDGIEAKTGAQISLNHGVSISGVDDNVITRLYSIDGQMVGTTTGRGTISAPAGIYILKVGAMTTKVKVEE